jgi:hypothetical protein
MVVVVIDEESAFTPHWRTFLADHASHGARFGLVLRRELSRFDPIDSIDVSR